MPQVLDKTVDIINLSPPYNLGDDNRPMVATDGRRVMVLDTTHGDDMTRRAI